MSQPPVTKDDLPPTRGVGKASFPDSVATIRGEVP